MPNIYKCKKMLENRCGTKPPQPMPPPPRPPCTKTPGPKPPPPIPPKPPGPKPPPKKKKLNFKTCKKNTINSLHEVEHFLRNFNQFSKYIKLYKILGQKRTLITSSTL